MENLKSEFCKELKELNNIHEKAIKEMNLLEVSLNDYKTELKQLREKYNVDEIEKQISEQFKLKHNSYENIIRIKYKYIADLIFNILNVKFFNTYASDNQKKKEFFEWLFVNYKIKYYAAYSFISFETFYADYLNSNYKNIDISWDNRSVKAYEEYYFRNELDDKVTFEIPMSVIDKVETVAEKINNYVQTVIKKEEEARRLEKEKIEKQEYEQFLRLKEKYENKTGD